jgi:hypothetical protein
LSVLSFDVEGLDLCGTHKASAFDYDNGIVEKLLVTSTSDFRQLFDAHVAF